MSEGRFVDLGRHRIEGLKGKRGVRVFVPDLEPPYPVAYCWDGQNLFDDEGSSSGGWHVHETLAGRAEDGLFAPMVVAIEHGGRYRIRDYAPWPTRRFGNGRAAALVAWVVETLKPAIDGEFPTLGREGTLVCGSSMGGLLSLFAWLRHPEVFGRAMAMSPSLWFNAPALFEEIEASTPWEDGRLYLDIGKRESSKWMRTLVEDVGWAVVRRGLDGERVMVRVDSRGRHQEAHWGRRLPGALDFLGEP